MENRKERGERRDQPRITFAVTTRLWRVCIIAKRKSRTALSAMATVPGRPLFFFQEGQVRFVTSVFHFFLRNEMQGGGVNGVTLAGGRFRVGKEMAKVGVASLRPHLGALHIVRSVLLLDEGIF